MIEDEVGARVRWFRDGAERRARSEALPRTTGPRTRRGDRLKTLLQLGDSQLDFVWACACAAIDPLLHAPLVTIGGVDTRRGITLAAYAHLSGLDDAELAVIARWLADTPIVVRLRMIAPAMAGLLPGSTPYRASARLASYLAGDDGIDTSIARLGGVVQIPEPFVLDAHHEEVIDQLEHVFGGDRLLVVLVGPRGVGRRTVVAAAAARSRKRVIAIDASRATGPELETIVHAVIAEAVLADAIPVFGDAHEVLSDASSDRRRTLAAGLDDAPGTVVVTTNDPAFDVPVARPTLRFDLRAPDAGTRGRLWSGVLGDRVDATTIEELATRYALGPAAIRTAATMVMSAQPTKQHLVSAIRHGIVRRFGGLADRLEVQDRWADVVLPAETKDQLDALVSRVRHAYRVFEDWRFPRSTARGGGVAALFSGPPGTGKTLVAGLIALELDRELYRVDLSRVVSKWVGETEKQLGELFDAAESSDALLLFDEADSLFARRTEVRSSSDRYANLEVNYLLQRIETFHGITILTTNLDTSIDAALRRRLATHIVFWPPEHDERVALWKRYATCGAPVRGELDFEELAEEFPDMTGANIRNASLAAAFLAAAADGPISQELVVRAARGEYRAMGRVLGRK